MIPTNENYDGIWEDDLSPDFELKDLFGEQIPYVMSEVKQRITDAVLADDRMEAIENFEVERAGKHGVHCMFTAITVQGDEINVETEVYV